MASLELLPSNVVALRLTKPELVSLKRTREGTLLRKQEAMLHVPRATEWLQYAISLARASTTEMSYARLAAPLLLLSGRRTGEVLNGISTFTATERATICIFDGQLKKRGAAAPFAIPLLCDVATFTFALNVLRKKQGCARLDAPTVNGRYAKNLNAALPTLFPIAPNAHALRAVYAAYAFEMYVSNVTFNRFAMRALGHDELTVSLAYNNVKLHDAPPSGCCGPAP